MASSAGRSLAPPSAYRLDWELATASQPLCLRDVGFILMASAKHKHRQAAARETWARDVAPSDLLFVTNTSRAEVRLDRAGANTFYAAQRRQFAVIEALLTFLGAILD